MAKQMSGKEKQRILELYAQGFCRQDIARDLHRAPSTVTKFLAKQETLPEVKPRIKPERALERDDANTPAYCQGCVHRRKAVTNCKQTYCWYANDMADLYGDNAGITRDCPIDKCTYYQRRNTNGTSICDD